VRLTAVTSAVFLFAGARCFAQFHDLATVNDGQQVYFSSALRLRGTDQFFHDKIFRYSSSGLELVAERDLAPSTDPRFSNYYRLLEPDVSGDGKVLSYVAARDCYGGSGCIYQEINQGLVELQWFELTLPGKVQLSRSGRYALQFSSTAPLSQVVLKDLTTGANTNVAVTYNISPHQAVTSGGTVVYFGTDSLYVWSAGQTRSIAAPETPTSESSTIRLAG
jgi:hypothetical protein